jgi:hypothetical protein
MNMTLKFCLSALLSLGMFLSVKTPDISGKWAGSFTGLDGNRYTLFYDFSVNHDTVTGSAAWPEGKVSIDSGSLRGDQICFTLDFGGEIIPHSGTCYRDSVAMDIILNATKIHFTLKRIN